MGYITSIILLLLAFVMQKKKGTWFSPDVLFCYEWFAISFLASLHLFTMYEVSSVTWFLILVGSLSFCVGVNANISNRNIKAHVGCFSLENSRSLIAKKWYFFLYVLVLLSYIPLLVQTLLLLQSGIELNEVRSAFFGGTEFSGYKRNTGGLFAAINYLQAFGYMLVVANGIFVFVKDRKFLYLLSAISLVIIDSVVTGGRFNIAYFVIELIICFEIFSKAKMTKSKKGNLKTKFVVGTTVLLFAYLFVSITFLRGAESDEIVIKYYRYFCGCIPYFDVRMPQIDKDGIWYFGLASFYGITNMIFPVLHIFGVPYPDTYKTCIENVNDTQEFMKIGTDMSTNAFVTPFYHLYADGRLIGIIIGMLFFGLIAGKVFKNIVYRASGANVIFYLLICQMIFETLYHYPFVNLGNGLFLLLWLFFWNRKKFA